MPGLPEAFAGFSFYFVSDIHRRLLDERMLARVDHPDLVIIGGDLLESGVPFTKVAENLKRLSQYNVPILFVWGNHDLHVHRQALLYIFNKFKVKLLTNDVYKVVKGGEQLNIIGVDDATNERDRLDEALSTINRGHRLLISHNPVIVEKMDASHHIPLVVSGHTHGGQIRLFGWGPREKGGVKKKPFGTLIISNGYGTTRFPLRLGAVPDTLFITLKS